MLLANQNVDILGIMEVIPTGVNWLPHLLRCIRSATLNDNWCYDVVKGSVDFGVDPGEDNINGPGSLEWQSGQRTPRREGYAFFWNNSSVNFSMLPSRVVMSEGTRYVGDPGPRPANAASLTLRGRATTKTPRNPWVTATGGINPPNDAFGNWEDWYYPESAAAASSEAYYERSRRPAYTIIQLKGQLTERQKFVPLMIYHAPLAAPEIGTFTSAMAQELYAVHTRLGGNWQNALLGQSQAVAAGDYNLPVTQGSAWDSVYGGFRRNFGAGANAGGQMAALYDDVNVQRTVVQTNDGFANSGDPIVSGNAADYYRAPIDEMFVRVENVRSNRRLLVPELIREKSPLVGYPVNNFKRSIAWAINHHNNAAGPIGNGGPMSGPDRPYFKLLSSTVRNDWADFQDGINQGYMGDARSAALFYRTFISDHLPLMIDFEV